MIKKDHQAKGNILLTKPPVKISNPKDWGFFYCLVATGGAIFFVLLFCKFTSTQIDMAAIRHIESRNNPIAKSKAGAIGLYQITPVVLKEYNKFNKTSYIKIHLFNPVINHKIAKWYLTRRIPQMLIYFKKPVTLENTLICYNAGIRAIVKGYMPRQTRAYIYRYKRLARKER